MKVSLKWLNEYVDVPGDLKAFCDRLDLTGTGVEGVERTGDSFGKIVTAQVLEKEPHPDSDHMWVCKVDVGANNVDADGNPEPLQIVCGAQNFNAGDHIVTALIGATLPGDFTIKKSKLRGVTSMGMNCSERELGLGNDHDGIIVLPPDAPVGVPFADYMQMSDTVLDLEITPNRPDCLSMVGMAREVGAMYRSDVAFPLYELEEDASLPNVADLATVEIEDPARCARYTARVIKNVKIGPSPAWLAERVTAAGARSINNVVDVTNYILFLYGQPLHAFDYDKLVGSDGKAHIIVRAAADGEQFTTLDGEQRTLTDDMTVISTPDRAVALAGVMGGLDSEITEESTTVLLEAATFEHGRTSRTSRNLGLISESSMRYERGVDDNPIADYSAAAAALLAEVSGGSVCPGIVDVYPAPTAPVQLQFRIPRFCQMMGVDVPQADIVDILERLDCDVDDAPEGAEVLQVLAPTCRPDLEREIDLYEEVLRLWGMDLVPPTLPASPDRVGALTEAQLLARKVNRTLTAAGLNETTTYSFTDPDDLVKLRLVETLPAGAHAAADASPRLGEFAPAANIAGDPVELINPMNAEQSLMRVSIVPGLLRSVAYNQAHGVKNVQLYESGVVFFAHEGRKSPKERERVAAVLAGAMDDASWNNAPAAFDFFDGKGAVESLARELAIPKLRFKAIPADEAPFLQPGRAADVYSGGTKLGWVGELHPLAVDAFEATAPVVAFELDMDALGKTARIARDYVDVPEFPPVDVDVAFVVDEDVTNERLVQCMTSAGGKLLADVRLFDVYRDAERLGAGKKSMAYALTYRAADRTLTGEEVERAQAKLVKKVCAATKAEVRA
ncbi:MAG TPA: phenylalanine--tRNA ligase subunit beta [Eggerthellaceae bacterium]|nr:phenylalanine--tRNA ligase subunit beta [Eggerthellaceae bacterium]